MEGFAKANENGHEIYVFRTHVGEMEHTDHTAIRTTKSVGYQFVIIRDDGMHISYLQSEIDPASADFSHDYKWASNKAFVQVGSSNLLFNTQASAALPTGKTFSGTSIKMQINLTQFHHEVSGFADRLLSRQNIESHMQTYQQQNPTATKGPRLPIRCQGLWTVI